MVCLCTIKRWPEWSLPSQTGYALCHTKQYSSGLCYVLRALEHVLARCSFVCPLVLHLGRLECRKFRIQYTCISANPVVLPKMALLERLIFASLERPKPNAIGTFGRWNKLKTNCLIFSTCHLFFINCRPSQLTSTLAWLTFSPWCPFCADMANTRANTLTRIKSGSPIRTPKRSALKINWRFSNTAER